MIDMADKIKGLKVLLLTDKGWFEVELSNDLKKEIFKLIDKQKIKLLKL